MQNRTTRKLLSWLLTLTMLLTMLPTAVFATEVPLEEGNAPTQEETAELFAAAVRSIAVTTLPDEIKLMADGVFEVTGGKLTVYYSDNTSEEIDLTGEMITHALATYDAYGVPAYRYTVAYGGKTTDIYIRKEPILTFTTAFNGNELLYAVEDAGCAFDTVVDMSPYDASLSFARNGVFESPERTLNPAGVLAWLNTYAITDFPWSFNGVKTEVFANEDGIVDRIVVTESVFDEVVAKVEDNASTPLIDERKLYTINCAINADDEVDGFDEVFAAVEEGDYVVVIPGYNNSMRALRIYVPTTVSGDVTYYKAWSEISIDGVKYKMSKNYTGSAMAGDENVALYLDEYGYAIGAKWEDFAAPSAVVLDTYQGLDANGEIVDMAHVLYADGTTERVECAYGGNTLPGFTAQPIAGNVYLYDYNDDGEMCFAPVPSAYDVYEVIDHRNEGETYAADAQTIAANAKSITLGTGRNYFAADCKFLFVAQNSNGEWTYAVADKLQNIADTVPVYATIDGDGNISTLYIIGVAAEGSGGSDAPEAPGEIEGPNSLVVLDTYQGLNANGEIVDMMHVLYADGTTARVPYGASSMTWPTEGNVYLYSYNNDEETCLTAVPAASGVIDATNKDETYTATITATESTKSIALGPGRNYFADDCKFIYVSEDWNNGAWRYTVSDKLQDLNDASVAAVIDGDGNISTLYIFGVAAQNTVKDSASLIFIAGMEGTAVKLDKDGKRTDLVCYKAFIDGVAVEGFVSEYPSVAVGFYENEYDTENGWYVLNTVYSDAAEDIQVTGAESFTASSLAVGKYIVVDGGVDVELTAATKYASAVDGVVISSLAELRASLYDNDPTDAVEPTATSYVVYDSETCCALYVYITDGVALGAGGGELAQLTLPISTECNANELLAAVTAAGYIFDTTYDAPIGADVTLQLYQNGKLVSSMNPAVVNQWLAVNATTDFDWSGKGVKVEVTANDEGAVTRIDSMYSVLETVVAKAFDKASTPLVDERAIYTDNFVIRGDDGTEGFDEVFAAVEEDDRIVIIPDDRGSLGALRIYEPTEVIGDVSYYKIGTNLIVGGGDYSLAQNAYIDVNAGDENVTLYLDEFGYAIGAEREDFATPSAVVLSTYQALTAEGTIVDMAHVLYADGTTERVVTGVSWDFAEVPMVGNVYLYNYNDDGEMCFAPVPSAQGFIDRYSKGATYAETIIMATESSKSIALGSGRNYFADDCKFIYVSFDWGNDAWRYTVSDKLQELNNASVAAVIDGDGNISTLYIFGVAAQNTVKDSASLIFIAGMEGTAVKLDKDGKRTDLVCYKAFIDGVAVEGFVSEYPSVAVGFYENEYDTENGWYVLNTVYSDAAEDIQVTGAESFTASSLAVGKYIVVDGGVDVELTAATRYASAVEGIEINSLADLLAAVADNDPTDPIVPVATIYVVYDAETGEALYVYVTDGDLTPVTATSISVSTLPAKTKYIAGEESLDVTGGKIAVHYDSGSTKVIDLTADMVTGFNNTVLGKQTLTVKYQRFTTTFDVEVLERSAAQLSAISGITNGHIVLFVESAQEISTQVLHVALYSGEGQMLDYIIVPTFKPYTTTNVVFDDDENVKTAKVFLWDSLTTTTPVAKAVEVTIR